MPALDEPTEPDNFTHAAIYEIEGSAADAMAALDAAVTSGRMNLPGWFGQIRFSSWHAAPPRPSGPREGLRAAPAEGSRTR